MKLWMSMRPTRWYIVPDDVPWPDGSHEVQDILGRSRRVDLDVLLRYLVTPADAQTFADQQTAEIHARLDLAQPQANAKSPGPDPSAAMAELFAPFKDLLQDRGQVEALLRSFGVELSALENAEPEAIGALAADVLTPLVVALEDPAARPDALRRTGEALRRHGMDGAADRLASAPEEVTARLAELGMVPPDTDEI